jgi:hypothetical protein
MQLQLMLSHEPFRGLAQSLDSVACTLSEAICLPSYSSGTRGLSCEYGSEYCELQRVRMFAVSPFTYDSVVRHITNVLYPAELYGQSHST